MPDPLYASSAPGVVRPAERLLDRLVHALLPAPCLGCGRPLPAAGAPLGLCAVCRAALAPLPREACAVCSRPLAAHALPADYRCGACRQSPPAFDRLLALWSYRPPLDAVVRGLKFGRLDYLGRHLADALAAGLGDQARGLRPGRPRAAPLAAAPGARLQPGGEDRPPSRRPPRPPLRPALCPPPRHAAAEPARPGASASPISARPSTSPTPSASAVSTSCWSTTSRPPERPWTPPPRPSRKPERRPSPPWWRDGRRSSRLQAVAAAATSALRSEPPAGDALRAVLPDDDEISGGAESRDVGIAGHDRVVGP